MGRNLGHAARASDRPCRGRHVLPWGGVGRGGWRGGAGGPCRPLERPSAGAARPRGAAGRASGVVLARTAATGGRQRAYYGRLAIAQGGLGLGPSPRTHRWPEAGGLLLSWRCGTMRCENAVFSEKKPFFGPERPSRRRAVGALGRDWSGQMGGVPGVHEGTLGGCSAGASPPRRAAACAAGAGFGARGGHRRHSAGLLGLACDRTVGPRARTSRSHAWASRGGRLVAQLGMGCGSMQTAFGH